MSAAIQSTITVTVPPERLFPLLPPGCLFVIKGTWGLSKEEYDRVSGVPGCFFRFEPDSIAMPAASDVAFGVWTTTGKWPDPLYIPLAQKRSLERVLLHTLDDLLADRPRVDVIAPFRGLDPDGKEYRLVPWQAEAVRRHHALRRSILSLPTGLGKTFIAIGFANDLLVRGDIDRVVVTPPRRATRDVWLRDIRRLLHEDAVVVDGTPEQRASKWLEARNSKWVILRYDAWRLADGKAQLPFILGPRTLCILDEVHRLKNPMTKKWRATRDMLNKTETDYRLFLTGTLLYDSPVDAFGPLELLGAHIWNTSMEFEQRYFNIEETRTGRFDKRGRPQIIRSIAGLKGPAEAEELMAVIDAVSFHRTAKELGYDKVPMREDLQVTATAEETILYEDVVRTPLEEILAADLTDKARSNSVAAMMVMERLLSDDPMLLMGSDSPTAEKIRANVGHRLLRSSPGSKLRALLSYLGDFVESSKTEKAIVFSDFHTAIDLILNTIENPPSGLDEEEREAAESLKGKCILYHGGLTDKQGDAQLERFRNDPNIRVLLSTGAGGESVNLPVATTLIFFDEPLSMGQKSQREGRIFGGLRQSRPVLFVRIEFGPTKAMYDEMSKRIKEGKLRFVDVRIRDLLEWKAGQRDMVLG